MKKMQKNKRIINMLLCIVLCIIFIVSCNDKHEGTIITPDAPPKEDLISNILTNCDTIAYNALLFYYPDDFTILPMAIHMAEHQEYGKAYSDLFYTFYSVFNDNSVPIDSITQNHMLFYLEKGIELKDTDCVWIMSKLYMTGTFVEKDTILAKKYLMIVFSQNDIESLYWPLLKNGTKNM